MPSIERFSRIVSIGFHLKAAISLSVITLSLAIWCIPLVVLALVKWLIPGLAPQVDSAMDGIYRIAVAINDRWLLGVLGIRFDGPVVDLPRDANVLVLANHTSWADILIIQSVVVGRGPILKFLTKRELIYIPIFGIIFWAFDFPSLRRSASAGGVGPDRRKRDADTLRDVSLSLIHRPAALMNFAEGTRFSEAKRDQQGSRYTHLLEPRVGGLSALLDALEGHLDRVLDLTLVYPGSPALWSFLSGRGKVVMYDAELIDVRTIPRSREDRTRWLVERWSLKDRRIDEVRGRETAAT